MEYLNTALMDAVDGNGFRKQQPYPWINPEGRLTDADPLVAVMVATRWLFYFWTVEKCFGVPMHFGMDAQQAVDGFIRILRNGVLSHGESGTAPVQEIREGRRT